MKRPVLLCIVVGVAILATSSITAHPHFKKSVTARLPGGVEATLSYGTTPANESHAASAAVGSFVTPRRPRLSLSADLTVSGQTIAAGEYTIGVIKNGADDWTMGLYPGQIRRGSKPDMTKVIKLDSIYTSSAGEADHMLLDITPGSGKFKGKAVVTLHFGSMFLAGALS